MSVSLSPAPLLSSPNTFLSSLTPVSLYTLVV